MMPILYMRKRKLEKLLVQGLTVRKMAVPRQQSQALPLLDCAISFPLCCCTKPGQLPTRNTDSVQYHKGLSQDT